MPDLRESVVLVAAPKKIHLKRKTPHTIVTMVDKLNIDPHPDAINLQDVVVQAPVGSAKPGEQLPRQKMKQIKGPAAKQKVPSTDAVMEKAEQFAPKLTQPLASLPLIEQYATHIAPIAQVATQNQDDSDALHYFNHTFIMEQLDIFAEDLFGREVASLLIPSEVIYQAFVLIHDMRNDSVEINELIGQLKEHDNRMKNMKSKFVIKQLEESYEDVNKALTILQHRRLGFHSDLDQIVHKICLDHQAKVTGYNDLVKGHIDPSKKKKNKIAKKNAPPPPEADTQKGNSPV